MNFIVTPTGTPGISTGTTCPFTVTQGAEWLTASRSVGYRPIAATEPDQETTP